MDDLSAVIERARDRGISTRRLAAALGVPTSTARQLVDGVCG